MEYAEFKQKLITSLPVGTTLPNPRKGTSTIEAYSYDTVTYRRGSSNLYVRFQDLYEAWQRFQGGYVHTTDLKAWRPEVFDSTARPAGHDCNCTFLFLVLQRMGLGSKINGSGVSGSPFFAFFYKM